MTPQELRAEADRLDQEAAQANRGIVYVYKYSGWAIVHDGGVSDQRRSQDPDYREATVDEVKALQTIPEFAAYLEKMRAK
jgi:hypothetical protein